MELPPSLLFFSPPACSGQKKPRGAQPNALGTMQPGGGSCFGDLRFCGTATAGEKGWEKASALEVTLEASSVVPQASSARTGTDWHAFI